MVGVMLSYGWIWVCISKRCGHDEIVLDIFIVQVFPLRKNKGVDKRLLRINLLGIWNNISFIIGVKCKL